MVYIVGISIAKSIDQMPNVEKVPPTFYILKEPEKLGYLQLNSPQKENSTKYLITNAGIELLQNLNQEVGDRPHLP